MKHSVVNKALEIAIWGIILLGVSLSLASCGKSPEQTQVTLKGINRIIIFGDSIAAGNHTNTNYGLYLSQRTGLPVINLAVGGTTLVSAEQYTQIMATSFSKGDLVLYTPGINDISLHWGDATYWTQYQTDLAQIVQYVTQSGAVLVLGTTLHTLNQVLPDSEVEWVGSISKQQLGVELFDGYTNFVENTNNMLNDDVHPNDQGETQLGELYLSFLQSVL